MQRREATTMPTGQHSSQNPGQRQNSDTQGTVLTPTEARQASPRRMNLRVLVGSLILMGVIGLALTIAFYGDARQVTAPAPAPAATPAVTAPAVTNETAAPSPAPPPAATAPGTPPAEPRQPAN